MQMSEICLFVFVEGWSDRYFFSRLFAHRCQDAGVSFRIVTSPELPNELVGKRAVLDFFAYMRRGRLLVSNLAGKKTGTLFCVDKDIDDLVHQRKRSAHLFYTEHYETENYYFIHGDLIEVAAAAASLDRETVHQAVGNASDWRRSAATRWKAWVVLCLFNQIKGLGLGYGYGRQRSIINTAGGYGITDRRALRLALRDCEAASHCSRAAFREQFSAVRHKVEVLYERGKWDKVFKGKWYAGWLAATVREAAEGRQINQNGLEDRILSSLPLTMDFAGAWSGGGMRQLDTIIAAVA